MKKRVPLCMYFLMLIVTLVSCSSKTKIEIDFDTEQKGLLVFDEKDTVKLVGDSTIVYEISSGEHTFVINKEKPQTVKISSEGGILNLNKNRYIRFYEKYSEEAHSDLEKLLQQKKISYFDNDIVVIDSLVYVYKEDSTSVVSDEQIKSALKNYENTRSLKNNIKLYNADLFIPKDWDFGLTEDLPETISVTSNSSSSLMGTEIRTKIMNEKFFRLMSMFMPQNFIVKSKKEIMSNKTDKKVDEEKKKNQLDF